MRPRHVLVVGTVIERVLRVALQTAFPGTRI